jgi:hypothetical protein
MDGGCLGFDFAGFVYFVCFVCFVVNDLLFDTCLLFASIGVIRGSFSWGLVIGSDSSLLFYG